jgi:hypothetical protein
MEILVLSRREWPIGVNAEDIFRNCGPRRIRNRDELIPGGLEQYIPQAVEDRGDLFDAGMGAFQSGHPELDDDHRFEPRKDCPSA